MVQQRRLKVVVFTIGGQSFDCQLQSWTMDPGEDDGDRQWTFCSEASTPENPTPNSFIEETDGEPTLQCTFYSDWRENGISDYLYAHNKEVADFVLDHHPDIVGEHVRWSGQLVIKAPPVGGDARDTEQSEVTFQVLGSLGDGLTYERVA
ncbi:hypothetical protein [Labedaea rhizosphaerae]|uniref:Uncharacterized protein n=1 Tax=Labedaea rhizosphaerae TaxID=598644 RepID=A0A4R6SC59_LABRH|nr:hypothetical protein [Labedaea rhizosphaerae]TDP97649.1 hypothetical protein EV186_103613 [Labedaea rhizosphaerae]